MLLTPHVGLPSLGVQFFPFRGVTPYGIFFLVHMNSRGAGRGEPSDLPASDHSGDVVRLVTTERTGGGPWRRS
jgi:hypothetical protein